MEAIQFINKVDNTICMMMWVSDNVDVSKISLPNGNYLFVGSIATANSKQRLLDNNITNIICCIKPNNYDEYDHYNDNYAYNTYNHDISLFPFSDTFKYHLVPIKDLNSENIYHYFNTSADYIHNALECGGNALIHCYQGVSRSGAILLAYLIKYHNMDVDEALHYARKYRAMISPNTGFTNQLKTFYNEIKNTK